MSKNTIQARKTDFGVSPIPPAIFCQVACNAWEQNRENTKPGSGCGHSIFHPGEPCLIPPQERNDRYDQRVRVMLNS